MFKKIKKEIGEYRDLHGLIVLVVNRFRMYFSIFGISFLVLERIFAIMNIDLGFSELVLGMASSVIYSGMGSIIFLGLGWMYIDLKFIIPSERRSSTGRDPVIGEILNRIKKIESLCSNSELQQREIQCRPIQPDSFAWLADKKINKNSGGR